MPRLLLAALLVLLAPAALAQTCTTSWTNPAGGSWDAGPNWNNGVPGPGSTACIALAGTYTVMSGGTNRALAGLVVGGASGVQTLSTGGEITLSGPSAVRASGRWEFVNRVPGGSDGLYTPSVLTVEGVVSVPAGVSFLTTGGTLDVATGGTMRVTDAGGIGGVAALFRVRGTLEATGCPPTTSAGSCQVDAPLEVLGGTVRAGGGVLFVRAGGTLAGATVDAVAGASLYLGGELVTGRAPYTVSGTLAGAPAGEIFVNGGRFLAGAGGATLALGGTGLQLGGSARLASAGGAFLNTGRLSVAETGSNFSGLDGTTLRNTGRLVLPGRSFSLVSAAVVRNEPAGVIEMSSQGSFGFNGGVDGRVENAGLLVANGSPAGPGSGATAGTISVPYDGLAGSTIRVQTGRLDLQAGGSFRDAAFDVPAASMLVLGNTTPFVAEGTLSGDIQGDFQINGELRAAAGVVTLALTGTGLLATRPSFSAALFTTAGGTFRNTGILRTGGLGLTLQQSTLDNAGTIRAAARLNVGTGSVLRNAAGATVELRSLMEGDGLFVNRGLLVKTAGTGTSGLLPAVQNLAGGVIRAEADAQLSFSALTDEAGALFSGTGRITPPAGFVVAGTIAPGTAPGAAGTLTWGGALATAPTFVLDIDVTGPGAAGTGYDRLVVTGAAALGGAAVLRQDAGYSPAIGIAFPGVLTATPVTGTFATQTLAQGFSLVVGAAAVDAVVTGMVGAEDAPGALAFGVATQANPSARPRLLVTLAETATLDIEVFDVRGRSVARLAGGAWSAGVYVLPLDGVVPGVYVARVAAAGQAGTERATQRLVVVR